MVSSRDMVSSRVSCGHGEQQGVSSRVSCGHGEQQGVSTQMSERDCSTCAQDTHERARSGCSCITLAQQHPEAGALHCIRRGRSCAACAWV